MIKTLITHWCFNCFRVVLPVSQGLASFPSSAGKEVHKKLELTRTADLNCPRGSSIEQNIMLSIGTHGRGLMLSGHLSAAVEQLHCASLAFLRLYSSLFFSMQLLVFFFQLWNCSHLISTHEVYSFCLLLAEVKPRHLPEQFCLPANYVWVELSLVCADSWTMPGNNLYHFDWFGPEQTQTSPI